MMKYAIRGIKGINSALGKFYSLRRAYYRDKKCHCTHQQDLQYILSAMLSDTNSKFLGRAKLIYQQQPSVLCHPGLSIGKLRTWAAASSKPGQE